MKELIYIVEDEDHIAQLVKYNIENEGFRTCTFECGEDMIKELSNTIPDLFLLDLMLPGIDGIQICKLLKQNTKYSNIPIIILTAKSDEFDKILGLELGADDYMTKPLSMRELIARIRAVLRRYYNNEMTSNYDEKYYHGNILIDCVKHEVYKDNKVIDVTFKEFELLKYLIKNKGKVLSREILLDKIWGYDYVGETRTVDVHIRYLRQKIEDDDSNPVYIETVRGIGYRFSQAETR